MACSRVNFKGLVFYICIVCANISTLTLPPGMSNGSRLEKNLGKGSAGLMRLCNGSVLPGGFRKPVFNTRKLKKNKVHDGIRRTLDL